MKHLIKSVAPGSIAEELEIIPGDRLLTINGQRVQDVFDYRFITQDECLTLEIEKPEGEIWELEIEKDAYEDLGLTFRKPLMDCAKHCRNKCVFCFIDQLPPDMRGTLYFKDDDPRLSFLTGNYVSLTNLSKQEARRIAQYHLSPLRISVHTTNPELRQKITGNPNAGRIMPLLRLFNDAGITMHFQIVLCRGLNDGTHLDESIGQLLSFQPGAASLSVVPAGLTRFRSNLYPLEPFSPAEAADVIRQIERWQAVCKSRFGSVFVFGADEFYIKAGIDIPPYANYEDFPQLENGVGMTALFEHQFVKMLKRLPVIEKSSDIQPGFRIGIATGYAAGAFVKKIAALFAAQFPWVDIKVYEIENKYFGSEITVSGLLTAADIITQLRNKVADDGINLLFLPRNAFRAGKPVTLDDKTPADITEALGVPVKTGSGDGGRFCRQLYRTVSSR